MLGRLANKPSIDFLCHAHASAACDDVGSRQYRRHEREAKDAVIKQWSTHVRVEEKSGGGVMATLARA